MLLMLLKLLELLELLELLKCGVRCGKSPWCGSQEQACCQVHWLLYVLALTRIPDDKCLTHRNTDPSKRVQTLTKMYPCPQVLPTVCESDLIRVPTYQATPVT